MTVEVRIVENKIPAILARVESQSRAAVKAVADAIARDASARAPVGDSPDGEHLYQNIEAVSVTAGKEAEVQVNSDHGLFVENGTYKMAAQPYLYPATLAHEDDLPEAILTIIEESA